MMPNPDSKCVFLKRGEPSRFELAERYKEERGKGFTPYDVPSHPVAHLKEIPEDDGGKYSIVCREDRGSFRVDKDGNCFSDDDSMRPIGHITDFDEQQPTKEELEEFTLNLRKRMKEMIGDD
jgi:hypothetical protein